MTVYEQLTSLQTNLQKKIKENDYRLAIAQENELEEPELVHPSVVIGNMPHINLADYPNDIFQAPYILIGLDEATFESYEGRISILIQTGCYTSTNYETNDEYAMKIPDNTGMLDTVSFLEQIMMWIKESMPLVSNVKMGTYDSKAYTYPYSYGYLQFDLETTTNSIGGKYEWN